MLIGLKQAENGMKTGKKLVTTKDDVIFRYFDRLEHPTPTYQDLSLTFSTQNPNFLPFFVRTDYYSKRTPTQNLEEQDKI